MYHQAHLPVRKQSEAVGHAVRAVYLYSGMADVARLTEDEEMYQACRRLWDSIVNEKLYITGGIGGTHVGEAFSFPYDLPNDTAYSETCAAVGLAFFARRMLEIRAESRYADVMEQALYNTVLAGMSLDGKSFFYVNPLESVPEACRMDERKHHVKSMRQKWFGCACCPPNIARIVSSFGAYMYTQNQSTLFTHLYAGSTVECTLNGKTLELWMECRFPWEGEVKAVVHTKDGKREDSETMDPEVQTLAFRIPGWCSAARAEVRRSTKVLFDGLIRGGQIELSAEGGAAAVDVRMQEGYLYLTAQWQEGDEIHLSFPMEVRMISASARVRENVGKVAFTRGPICYCLEEADNGKDLHLLRVDREKLMSDKENAAPEKNEKKRWRPDLAAVEDSHELGHEMRVLKIPGKRRCAHEAADVLYSDYAPAEEQEVTLTFVPYYGWNNRGEGEMRVWVSI